MLCYRPPGENMCYVLSLSNLGQWAFEMVFFFVLNLGRTLTDNNRWTKTQQLTRNPPRYAL